MISSLITPKDCARGRRITDPTMELGGGGKGEEFVRGVEIAFRATILDLPMIE